MFRYQPHLLSQFCLIYAKKGQPNTREELAVRRPFLMSVPLDTPHTLPYGVVYSVRAGEDVLKFVKILQHEAEKIK